MERILRITVSGSVHERGSRFSPKTGGIPTRLSFEITLALLRVPLPKERYYARNKVEVQHTSRSDIG